MKSESHDDAEKNEASERSEATGTPNESDDEPVIISDTLPSGVTMKKPYEDVNTFLTKCITVADDLSMQITRRFSERLNLIDQQNIRVLFLINEIDELALFSTEMCYAISIILLIV